MSCNNGSLSRAKTENNFNVSFSWIPIKTNTFSRVLSLKRILFNYIIFGISNIHSAAFCWIIMTFRVLKGFSESSETFSNNLNYY